MSPDQDARALERWEGEGGRAQPEPWDGAEALLWLPKDAVAGENRHGTGTTAGCDASNRGSRKDSRATGQG